MTWSMHCAVLSRTLGRHSLVSSTCQVNLVYYIVKRLSNFRPGHVGKQPLLDIIFTDSDSPTAGPFESVSIFHDWFTTAYGLIQNVQDASPHPYRSFLPDNVPIVFTHADLHPSNIILSSGPNPQVIAIIDWHQWMVSRLLGVLQSSVDLADWPRMGIEISASSTGPSRIL
jgi:hypothetical protein